MVVIVLEISVSFPIFGSWANKNYVCLGVRDGENMCVGKTDRCDWQIHCFIAVVAWSHSAQNWEITWKSIEHNTRHHWSEEGSRNVSMFCRMLASLACFLPSLLPTFSDGVDSSIICPDSEIRGEGWNLIAATWSLGGFGLLTRPPCKR